MYGAIQVYIFCTFDGTRLCVYLQLTVTRAFMLFNTLQSPPAFQASGQTGCHTLIAVVCPWRLALRMQAQSIQKGKAYFLVFRVYAVS